MVWGKTAPVLMLVSSLSWFCYAQCARDLKWVNGKVNNEGWVLESKGSYNNSGQGDMGACCAEMDLWEANKVAPLKALQAHASCG